MQHRHVHGHAPWTWRWTSTMDAGMPIKRLIRHRLFSVSLQHFVFRHRGQSGTASHGLVR
jgi:hypothetical protein